MKLSDVFGNSLFLLGAGGTSEAGCKTSRDMLGDLTLKIDDNSNDLESELKKEAYCFIRACLEYHSTWKNTKRGKEDFDPNIEEFAFILRKIIHRDHYIPYPLVGNWSEKIIQLESKNDKIFEILLNDIETKYLPKWLSYTEEAQSELLNPIRKFFQSTSKDNYILDIFSLNYDLVFESFFNTNGEILLNDGFQSGKWSDNFDLSFSKEKHTYRINYYKLHGSLNWSKNAESGEVERNNDYKPIGNPLIIFGQEGKMLSIDPFLSLISRFKNKLEEADYYFIVGYSFYDTYINNLLLEELYKAPQKKLIILKRNVNPDEIENKKHEIAEKISRIQAGEYNSSFYNVKRISPDKIHIVPLNAGKFYKQYFGNRGANFVKLINDISESDEPF